MMGLTPLALAADTTKAVLSLTHLLSCEPINDEMRSGFAICEGIAKLQCKRKVYLHEPVASFFFVILR
jgi:hypothetical protein